MRLLLVLPLLLASCELLDIEPPKPRNCSSTGGTLDLSGEWVIQGVGERTGCADSIWDGSFELGPSRGLEVMSTIPPSSEVHELSLAQSGGGFQLSGTVDGTCVEFRTSETIEGGSVSYAFEGGADGTSKISGTFTSSNPAGCSVEGTFEVTIKP